MPHDDQPELSQNTAKFIGLSNILDGIQDYAQGGSLEPNVSLSSARRIFSGRQRTRRTLSLDNARLLRISWQTELAARILENIPKEGIDPPDKEVVGTLIRVSAQTLPVQVYYAAFNLARCATSVAGNPCSTHAQVHKDYGNRARLAPGPWSVTLDGDPEDFTNCKLLPSILSSVPSFNPMERGRRPEEYLGLGLRMTRRWQIAYRRNEWLRDSRHRTRAGLPYKNLPSSARDQILDALRPTTLLDFVYELRRRTNYETADEYGSDADDVVVARFHDGMLYLLESCMLLYEADLVKLIGLAEFKRVSNAWRQSLGSITPWALQSFDRRMKAIFTAGQEAAL